MSSAIEAIRQTKDHSALMMLDLFPDGLSQAYIFRLGEFFPMKSEREYILEAAPMLYKARLNASQVKSIREVFTNGAVADLVEFPPVILKLLTNGDVVPLEGLPKGIGP